ncbi:BCD family MFS transporter [Peteryoungia desertarenae]|uniref:BCD family MFS transporter n=1 Tax=Peteryoungia desertarenae TaxID=1813451 RepID=A0ABX6QIW3_9HYPH|nr:BCD family MFS transporter [Peteryoungia desertarenae]QLF68503.1 BCD family MFS transporter [Peteryoungia desertarenae]
MHRTRAIPGPGDINSQGLGWLSIVRLGLIQAALGAIVVLTTSTLNRVMVVELGLAAMIPGMLVGIHYAVQISRPVWGHWSDTGGSRTLWILGGLALLAAAGTGAASTTLVFEQNFTLGLSLAILAYILIGIGIGACGTSLLTLIAIKTAPERRAAAATITWMMMIAGIVVSSVVTGLNLDPYSHGRLVAVTAITGVVVWTIAAMAIRGIENRPSFEVRADRNKATSFRESLDEVWSDGEARLFTLFILVSMLAYATQDLILEPFAGLLFDMTPGETTRLSGTQHAGILLGMAMVGLCSTLFGRRYPGLPKLIIALGCLGSAMALAALSISAFFAPVWPLQINVFLLGAMNGAFAVAAIGTMMLLASNGASANEGMRMGVWGAAQAISFGLGGVLGTVLLDLGRLLLGDNREAFALVFGFEALLFLLSSLIALRITAHKKRLKTDNLQISLNGQTAPAPAE